MNQEHIQFALPSSCRLCSNVAGPGSTTKKVLFFKNKLPNHMLLNKKTYMYQRVSIYRRVSISLCFCIRDYSQHKFDQRTQCRGPWDRPQRPERPERPETMLWTWWCEPLHSKRLLGQSPASMHWTKNWTSAGLPQHVSNILLTSCAVWWSMYVFAWACCFFSSMRRKISNCLLGELFNGAWDMLLASWKNRTGSAFGPCPVGKSDRRGADTCKGWYRGFGHISWGETCYEGSWLVNICI